MRWIRSVHASNKLIGSVIFLRDWNSTGTPDVTYSRGFIDNLPDYLRIGWSGDVSGTLRILRWREVVSIYSIPGDGHVSFELIGLDGRRLTLLDEGYRTAGSHPATSTPPDCPVGVHFLRLRWGERPPRPLVAFACGILDTRADGWYGL
ncbi:MAG: hypothetical protein KAY32_10450 [Candidatus Eisenbacteria sp.]|nr:hypothetical protein [Candidatus Eisenbacteria bacterium]